jgi:hypothetical protein
LERGQGVRLKYSHEKIIFRKKLRHRAVSKKWEELATKARRHKEKAMKTNFVT